MGKSDQGFYAYFNRINGLMQGLRTKCNKLLFVFTQTIEMANGLSVLAKIYLLIYIDKTDTDKLANPTHSRDGLQNGYWCWNSICMNAVFPISDC